MSKVKGLSETLRDIRTSTYQICIFKEKQIKNNHISQIKLEIYIENIEKRGEIAP